METGIHELTAGYALDALDPEERHAYEAHLVGCEQCQDELTSFWQTTEALAVAASGPVPRPELREQILGAARAERQVVVPFAPRRRLVPVLAGAAAMAAVLALAVGIWASQLSGDLDESRSALEQARIAAGVLADPGSRTVGLQAGSGRLVVGENGQAVLVLDELDPAPSEKTYEAWIIEGETPRPAGLFPGEAGLDVFPIEGTVDEGDVVAVTVERKGGVKIPETAPIVASKPI